MVLSIRAEGLCDGIAKHLLLGKIRNISMTARPTLPLEQHAVPEPDQQVKP